MLSLNQEIRLEIATWLSQFGINTQPSDSTATAVVLVCCVIVAGLSYLFVRRGVIKAMNAVIRRSKVTWDDVFMRHRVLETLALIVPALVLNILVPLALTEHKLMSTLVDRILSVWLVVLLIRAAYASLDAANEIADLNLVSRRLPIKSFVQLFKLFLFFVGIIVSISILADQSPVYFLSGLGVATGLVMLVFRDTILGFVAGIQLAANRMVSIDDWIEMDKYGANGAVEEVSLTTVKVRNWDKTVTNIPAYALVQDSFKNWRGMQESGGRRIMRSLFIDIETISFLTEEDYERLTQINLLKAYLVNKSDEIKHANAETEANNIAGNTRRLTNIGTFRAYLEAMLHANPNIREDMTFLVRQLEPTAQGLPIQIYVFTNDTRWAIYEGIQADIFDHIFSILPEFGLRAFQGPSGSDIRSLKS